MKNKRFMPLSLIKEKGTENLYIVHGDYSYLHGLSNHKCNFEQLSLYILDKKGKIVNLGAWYDSSCFDLVDTPKEEYFDKVTKWDKHYENTIKKAVEKFRKKRNKFESFADPDSYYNEKYPK